MALKSATVSASAGIYFQTSILAILVDKPSDKAQVLDILDGNARQLEPQAVPVALSHQICNMEKNSTD